MAANWITAEEAQGRLGVKLQTLYAYASRGLVSARSDAEDPRRSLYAADDIERLVLRKSRGRHGAGPAEPALNWTDPAVTSVITTSGEGRMFYRGQDAARFQPAEFEIDVSEINRRELSKRRRNDRADRRMPVRRASRMSVERDLRFTRRNLV